MRDIGPTRWGLSPTFVVFMTIFIDITGFGMIIPLLPFYAETFQAGPAALGILVASFSLMQFIFSPILGRFSDNAGRRPVLLLSILISSVSFIIFALANSFLMLLLSRIIAGMLLQFVDTPFNATYSAHGEAFVRFEGYSSHIVSVDGYRRVYVTVNGTSKTKSFDLFMGKLSGATLGERVANNQPADARIHRYDVKGPEVGLLLKGTPNSTDKVQLWMYLRP